MNGRIELEYQWWNGEIFSIPIPEDDKNSLARFSEDHITREAIMGSSSGAMTKKIGENVYHGLWTFKHKKR